MEYIVDLEVFHGPLDLLLYLIEESQVDIYDIPIAQITDQYMEYLSGSGNIDLEQIGGFLIMASYLLNLKSRMLLPIRENNSEMEEEFIPDPREELVQQLIAYRKYRKAAEHLRKKQEGENRVFYRQNAEDEEQEKIIVADMRALLRSYTRLIRSLKETAAHVDIPSGDINVEEKMDELMERLREKPEGIVFQELFTGVGSVREALAFFLGLLELVRLQLVEAVQDEYFSPIRIYLRAGIKDVNA